MAFDGGGGAPKSTWDGYFFELSVISFMSSEIACKFSDCCDDPLLLRRDQSVQALYGLPELGTGFGQIGAHRIEPLDHPLQTLSRARQVGEHLIDRFLRALDDLARPARDGRGVVEGGFEVVAADKGVELPVRVTHFG